MEVSRVLDELSLNRTVVFTFFTAEELGLLGSHQWVSENQAFLKSTLAVICLDGIGNLDVYSENRLNIMYMGELSGELVTLIVETSRELGYNKTFLKRQSERGIEGSDSGAFMGFGLRVVRMWDLETTLIHKQFDTPQTLNSKLSTKVAIVTLEVIHKLSNEPLAQLFPTSEKDETST